MPNQSPHLSKQPHSNKQVYGTLDTGRPDGSTGESHACARNTVDTCMSTPSIDFWPGGNEGASNTAFTGVVNGVGKEIMGRMIAHSGNTLQLQTTSGRVFSVQFPVDPVSTFNTERAQYYHFNVEIGDMMYVLYEEPLDAASTTITSNVLSRSSLILQMAKSGSLDTVKY